MSLDIKEGLYGGAGINFRRKNTQSIEEKVFNGALIAVEAHFRKMKIGPKSAPEIKRMVAATLDKSLNKADVRYTFLSSLFFLLPKSLMRQVC